MSSLPNLETRSPDGLPLPALLASPSPEATNVLARRLGWDAIGTVRALRRRGLVTYALHRLTEAGLGDEPGLEAMREAAAWELGFTAKRRLALADLDCMAGEGGLHPVLIKGAANCVLYYPTETLRVSQDIDVVLPREDIDRHFPPGRLPPAPTRPGAPDPHDHVTRQLLQGTPIEFHFRVGLAPAWGEPADVAAGATPLPGRTCLLAPSTEVALTIALLHFRKNRGKAPYDLSDVTRIADVPGLDWQAVADLWTGRGLAPLVAPGLIAAARVGGGIPSDVVVRVWDGLVEPDRALAGLLAGFALSDRFRLLREHHVLCRMQGRSFVASCARDFAGSRAVTRKLTGLTPKHPLFWLNHCVLLPLRRLRHCLR